MQGNVQVYNVRIPAASSTTRGGGGSGSGSGSLRRRANGSLRDRANGSLRDRFLQKACRACMRVDMFARDVCLYTRMREHVCACLCLSACMSHDICDVYVS